MNNNHCYVYIDESGDLGVNKGTTWFVLSAVIVDDTEEIAIRNTINKIRQQLNIRNIHFRTLRDFEQKAYVVYQLSLHRFTLINVVIDSRKISLTDEKTKYGDKPSLLTYNLAARYLIERVSWFLRDSNKRGDIILSSRGTSRDGELVDYIKNVLIPYPDNQVAQVFDRISSKSAASWDMLQLADVCATSWFYLYETNRYNLRVPYYAHRLSSHLYKYNGKWRGYGVKYYDQTMDPGDNYFKENCL